MNPPLPTARRGARPVSRCLADVDPHPVHWLWPGRLPLGKLTVLDGDPAVGKSTLTAEIAATVTTGRSWPDGAPCRSGAVVLMSAEDGLDDTIHPRVSAARGYIDLVHALVAVEDDTRGGRQERPVTLADLDAIEKIINDTEAVLLIIDVLMAYLPGGVDSYRDQDVRRVLAGLASLAERTGCAVLVVRHLTKGAGGKALYRGGGSIGIIGAARSALLAAVDPSDRECRVLAGQKSNLGPLPAALRYRIIDSPAHGCGRIEWLGTSPHTADALVADVPRPDSGGLAEELRKVLVEAGGEIAALEGSRRLEELHGSKPSPAAVQRAREKIGVISRKADFDGGWTWHLQGLRQSALDQGGEESADSPAPWRSAGTSSASSMPSTSSKAGRLSNHRAADNAGAFDELPDRDDDRAGWSRQEAGDSFDDATWPNDDSFDADQQPWPDDDDFIDRWPGDV